MYLVINLGLLPLVLVVYGCLLIRNMRKLEEVRKGLVEETEYRISIKRAETLEEFKGKTGKLKKAD